MMLNHIDLIVLALGTMLAVAWVTLVRLYWAQVRSV